MRNTIVEMIKAMGNDVDFRENGNRIFVTIDDFEGFDENFEEVFREYENPAKVDTFKNFLERECVEKDDDFYIRYHFNDCEVVLGYTSFDI